MKTQTPKNTSYDVVIIGGAMMGASAAWFLSDDKDFDGKVLVVDRDLLTKTRQRCTPTLACGNSFQAT